MVAGDAEPESALGKIESEAEAKDENDSGWPDDEGAGVPGDEKDCGLGSVVEGDGPLLVEGGGCFADVETSDGFVGGGGSAGCADADDEEGMGDLLKLEVGGVREEDSKRQRGACNGDATSEVNLEALGCAGLVEDDGLGADEAAGRVADGEGDRGDEGGLVEDDAIVGKGVVDAQVVATGDELAVTIDAEVGDVVGGQSRVAVERSGEGVDAETNVVGGATGVDDGALAGGESLIEGEAGEGIAEIDERSGEDVAGGTVGWEAAPL